MVNSPDMMPEHRAQLPRTGHPLSHDFGFTATCAHLLPVFHTVMNPGEKITLGMDYIIRTMPLAQAAMTQFDVHTEYFFVPMNLLYEPAAANLMRINDNYSSNFAIQNASSELPLLDWLPLQNYITSNRGMYVYGTNDDCLGRSAVRLFEMLDLNPYVADEGSSTVANSGNFFPYQLLAYHAIYQYRYRLDTREQFKNWTFNWDAYYGTPLVTLTYLEMQELCKLHCRPQVGDYFNSVKVSPIVDVLNLDNAYASFPLANQWLTRSQYGGTYNVLSSGSQGVSGSSSPGDSGLNAGNTTPVSTIQTTFGFRSNAAISQGGAAFPNGLDINTANIRAMFANEKLWSIIGRAKKRYDDQVFARFGYKVPHDVKHQISCFGHDISQIHIGEVISTASTSQAPLGEIAGKGYGQQNNRRHSFTAPCHGVVMMIFSITPRYRYKAGFARWNQITEVNDFYQPEFDHLGMQPMFMYELANGQSGLNTYMYGWEYRYQQFKQRYDKVTNAFTSGGTLYSWMLQKTPRQVAANLPNSENYQQFMYHPNDLNQIFLAQYSLAWPTAPAGSSAIMAIYDNDNFVVDSHITANLVSPMSKYSLSRLDE